MQFNVGDRVKLVKFIKVNEDDEIQEDSPTSPLYGGKYGKILGSVIRISKESYPIEVGWDNGEKNHFAEEELEKNVKEKLETGDRVIAIKPVGNAKLINVKGIVLKTDKHYENQLVCVEFDVDIGGHNGNNAPESPGKDKHCWNFRYEEEPGMFLHKIKQAFKIGDNVKLKDYTEYSDYARHAEQIGKIEVYIAESSLPYVIRWTDGQESRCTEDNLIKIHETTTERKEKNMERKETGKKVHVVDVVRHGEQILIPKGMNYDDAIEALQRKKTYEEQTIEIIEDIDTFVWDGAIALQKAMEQIFGWSTAETEVVNSFFGKMEFPPKMIQIECGVDTKISVAWGKFSLPGIEGHLETGTTVKKGKRIFCVKATVKRKYKENIEKLVELTRKIVKEQSIYKGKAIKMEFYDKSGEKIEMPTPTFIDAIKVEESEIIFSENVKENIMGNLYTPIVNSEICKQHKIPLKRGILLSGPYGTGKTLVANVTAKKCIENGWTFLMCEKATEIADMVDFAHQYQPAVVFCEDIDRVLDGERDVNMDDILNIIDGIESKKTEIIIVLTTNHVEKIHKAMLRPGRLDAIINVLPPDAKAVEKLIRIYGRGLIQKDVDLTEVSEILKDTIPAVIRECVERSKLYAISRNGHNNLKITASDLLSAADSMKHQLDLLYGDKDKETDTIPTQKIIDFLCGKPTNELQELIDDVKHIKNKIED